MAVQAYDYRGAGAATGDLNITSSSIVGIWAWSEAYDIFNTAVLQGGQVAYGLHAVTVSTFGPEDDDVQACSLVRGSSSGAALSVAPPLGSTCRVVVSSANRQAAKAVAVNVALRTFSKQVGHNVA